MQVRKLEEEDKEKLEEIIKQICEENWPNYPEELAVKELWLTDQVLVAKKNDEVVGVVGINVCDPYKVMEIGYLFVGKDSRLEGVGKKLIDAVEERARNRRKEVLRVYTGIKEEWAHEFYESCGFKESGVVKNFEFDGDKVVFFTKVVS